MHLNQTAMPLWEVHYVTVKRLKYTKTYKFYFHPTWHAWLNEAGLLGDQFQRLVQHLDDEEQIKKPELREKEKLWPEKGKWFAAFLEDPEAIRVVIVGQDPYPTPHKATGHSFEIAPTHKVDKSLLAILKNIDAYQQCRSGGVCLNSGDLSLWRRQGVFLLNTGLTVAETRWRGTRLDEVTGVVKDINQAKSYFSEWRFFTEGVIRLLCRKASSPLVFMLWGMEATKLYNEEYGPIRAPHVPLMSYHPSGQGESSPKRQGSKLKPFSSTQHFADTNRYFQRKGLALIDWSNAS